MQHEILNEIPLLDKNGNLTEAGFARSLLPVYSRRAIKASPLRIKERDYYLVSNGHYALALTVADNGYMGLDSISLIDMDNNRSVTESPMRVLPLGRTGLSESSKTGDTEHSGKGYGISFKNDGHGRRVLTAHMDKFGTLGAFVCSVELFDEPRDSMVICTPFDKKGHFYFNQKINCMRAVGEMRCGGKTYTFGKNDSFAVLDWGRGVCTYHNTWYWGSASYQVDGVPFGWNIGYGFGNCSAASENMLFYNGTAHKLSQVKFLIPNGEKNFMSPWKFTSDDGRFEMDFQPQHDRASCTNVGVIKSDQHQVFGLFTGKAVLDDGTVVNVKDFPGFAEKVENKW